MKKYKNIYIDNYHRIFYTFIKNNSPHYINVTDSFYTFKGNYSYPTKDDLDLFIFEYELSTGVKPHTELCKGIQADDL